MDKDLASLANSYSSLGEQRRYLGADPDRTKRLPRSYHYIVKGGSRTDAGRRTLIHRDLPEYKLGLLQQVVRHPDQSRNRVDRRRQLHRIRGRWGSDAQEGRDLALSDVPLPSDFAQQPRRCPSLERQEAFRYESTAKRRAGSSQSSSDDGGDAAAVAELYRLGLLYDDEHLRGSGFDFRSLERQEPAYSLRPATRARKLNRARGYDEPDVRYDNHPAGDFGVEQKLPLVLPLELSFAEIGRDDAIARFLISPSPSETSEDEDDDGDVEMDRAQRMQDFYDARALQRRLDELRGLAESVPTLFGEMVQEEEEDEEENVSDLVYDNDTQDTDLNYNDAYDTDDTEKGEKQLEDKYEEENDDDRDWTVLAKNDAGEVADAEDVAERDAATGGGGGAAGAWVMLGDDS